MLNILVYVDALPLESIEEKYTRETPFLNSLLNKGDVYGLQNIMGYSFGIQSTILTGKLPPETNHWMPYYFDPAHSSPVMKVFCSVPLDFVDRFFIYPYYYMNELPFFEELQKLMSSRANTNMVYIGPKIHKGNYVQICYDYLKNLKDVSNEDQFILLYLDKLDHRAHGSGYGSPVWVNTLKKTDKELGLLYELIKTKFDDFNFMIFSDHGLSNVKNLIDINKMVRRSGVSWKDTTYLIDATIVNFWFENDNARNKIIRTLDKIGSNKIIYFHKEDDFKILKKYGVGFSDRRYGDLIVQIQPEHMFFPNHYSDRKALKGVHGFLPDEEVQKSFIVVDVNSEGSLDSVPRHIKDVWNVMWALV